MPYQDKQKLYEAQKKHRIRNRHQLIEYLKDHHCIDCGESDIRVLDFDHVRGEKSFNIGTAITILQVGSGQTTIVAGSGVTVNATPGLKLRAQWSLVTLVKRATDTWVVSGDLTA